MSFQQPTGMTSDNGYIVTIGIIGGDRAAIVMPFCSPDTVDRIQSSFDLLDAIESLVLPQLVDCFSASAFVAFTAAEGMIDGRLPSRKDYAPTDWPGTRSTGIIPSQNSTLLTFYSDPDDTPGPGRVRVGKNFIPFIATDDIVGDAVVDAVKNALDVLGSTLLVGIPISGGVSITMYRVCAADKTRTPNTPIIRAAKEEARGYVATQRRRAVPH